MATRVVLLRPKRDYAGVSFSRTPKEEKIATGNTPPTPPLRSRGVGGGDSLSPVGDMDKAVAAAESLTPQQRRDLIAKLSLDLDAKHDPKSRDVEMWSTALHASLQEALGGALGASVGVMTFKTLVAPSKTWQPIVEFMTRSRLSEEQVLERQSLYYLLAELVVGYARKTAKHTGAPLTAKFVVNCSANIAGVFDSAFPGYLAAGLAPVVARQFAARK